MAFTTFGAEFKRDQTELHCRHFKEVFDCKNVFNQNFRTLKKKQNLIELIELNFIFIFLKQTDSYNERALFFHSSMNNNPVHVAVKWNL